MVLSALRALRGTPCRDLRVVVEFYGALIGLGYYEPSGDSSRRLSALRAGRVAEVLALLVNFSGALIGLGSYEPSGDSSRRLSACGGTRFIWRRVASYKSRKR